MRALGERLLRGAVDRETRVGSELARGAVERVGVLPVAPLLRVRAARISRSATGPARSAAMARRVSSRTSTARRLAVITSCRLRSESQPSPKDSVGGIELDDEAAEGVC